MPPDSTEEIAPWAELHRERRALVVVDVVESVRLMQQHEDDVIDRWRRFVNEVRTLVLPEVGGRLVKSLGDGMLLEFESVPQAVAAARAVLARVQASNHDRAPDAAIRLRLGLHVADVVIDDLDVYGAGVNLAARLATLAQPDELVVSAEVRDGLLTELDGEVVDLGECYFKHLKEPVRAFRLNVGAVPRSDPPTLPSLDTAVAVMPLAPRFVTASHAAAGELLCDEIVASLSRSPGIAVISRLSTKALAGRSATVSEIGRMLGAAYVVAGAFDCDGKQVVAQLDMSHAESGGLMWSHRWTVPLTDLLAGEADVVYTIVSHICRGMVQRAVFSATSAPLPSLDSYSLLLSGIGLIHRSSAQDFTRARALLEHLAERHARHPQANAWLGKWYVLRAVQGMVADPVSDGKHALACANRAISADPSSALALAMKGHVHGFLLKELDTAEAYLQDALRADPNESLAWIYLAALRAWQGRAAEGLSSARHALSLSPIDPLRYYYDTLFAFVAMSAGEHALAVQHGRRSLQAHRLHLSTHRTLAISLWHLNDHAAARGLVEEMLRIDPGFTVARYLARYPGGDGDQARLNAEVLRACGAPA